MVFFGVFLGLCLLFLARPSYSVIAVLGIAFLIGVWVILRSSDEPGRHTFEGMAAFLSCLALACAAYWYFVDRRGIPKLNATQNVQIWPIAGGKAFVRVELLLENVGNTDITIRPEDDFRLEIGRVLPARGKDVRSLLRDYHEVTQEKGPLEIIKTDIYPVQARIKGGLDIKIESGETDRRYFKAIVPCEDGLLVSARVELPKNLNWLQAILEDDKRQHYWRGQSVSNQITACNFDGGDDEES